MNVESHWLAAVTTDGSEAAFAVFERVDLAGLVPAQVSVEAVLLPLPTSRAARRQEARE